MLFCSCNGVKLKFEIARAEREPISFYIESARCHLVPWLGSLGARNGFPVELWVVIDVCNPRSELQ